jgi:predicted small metal-binding protein
MPRMMFDCRDWPGECTLAISGEEEEVIEAQLLHIVAAHGQQDSPQLREQIRASLKDAPAGA